jgi:diaminohydroxyphosphoribosylaminopyrimidine deaminase/5-amino-6-(5-phosphoribosylamino)uracil reductase
MNNHTDETWMHAALALAQRGEGQVEPNPMVGCVLVKDDQLIGAGWHERFGGPHAEVKAITSANFSSTNHSTVGATAYVTLEPCSHQGKTPPCSKALIAAGVARVVVAHPDPNPAVAGEGIRQLKSAGIEVELGTGQQGAAKILAPYLKRLDTGLPWIIAKWAMTLDGKIATASGDSQWISNEKSRELVHQLRSRIDGIMVGINTAIADDPRLTARPQQPWRSLSACRLDLAAISNLNIINEQTARSPRVPLRIVLDSTARLNLQSQLVRTAADFPTLVAVGPTAVAADLARLTDAGCEIWQSKNTSANDRLKELLLELGSRGLTNILVEGGGQLLGSLHDLDQVDEIHTFIGPKLIGGADSLNPLAGVGQPLMKNATQFQLQSVQQIDDDVYIIGRRSN